MKNKNKKVIEKILSNKTIHVEIPGSIHRKLRALLFLNEMSMQKFFSLMAESYVNSDPYIKDLVDKRVEEIKEDRLNNLRNVDKKDLYDAIEKNSPFK